MDKVYLFKKDGTQQVVELKPKDDTRLYDLYKIIDCDAIDVRMVHKFGDGSNLCLIFDDEFLYKKEEGEKPTLVAFTEDPREPFILFFGNIVMAEHDFKGDIVDMDLDRLYKTPLPFIPYGELQGDLKKAVDAYAQIVEPSITFQPLEEYIGDKE
jgi:hypothetical protein